MTDNRVLTQSEPTNGGTVLEVSISLEPVPSIRSIMQSSISPRQNAVQCSVLVPKRPGRPGDPEEARIKHDVIHIPFHKYIAILVMHAASSGLLH